MFMNTVRYLGSSRYRIAKVLIYGIYIYLFITRLCTVVRFFSGYVKKIVRSILNPGYVKTNLDSIKTHRKLGMSQIVPLEKKIIRRIYNRLIQSIKLFYHSFVMM